MKTIAVHKAEGHRVETAPESITIVVDEVVRGDTAETLYPQFVADAETLAEALWSALPGGTQDALLRLFLERRASLFRVPFPAPAPGLRLEPAVDQDLGLELWLDERGRATSVEPGTSVPAGWRRLYVEQRAGSGS